MSSELDRSNRTDWHYHYHLEKRQEEKPEMEGEDERNMRKRAAKLGVVISMIVIVLRAEFGARSDIGIGLVIESEGAATIPGRSHNLNRRS